MNVGKPVIILSVPMTASDDAIEDTLSEPVEHGYYLALMLEARDGHNRFVYKRTASYVDPAERAARDAEESKAVEIVRTHPQLSQGQIVGLLAAKGIKRRSDWVGQQRARIAFSKD